MMRAPARFSCQLCCQAARFDRKYRSNRQAGFAAFVLNPFPAFAESPALRALCRAGGNIAGRTYVYTPQSLQGRSRAKSK